MASAIYANARAMALSNSLLGKERLYRMIDSASVLDAVKILAEVNFGDGIKLDAPEEFEKLVVTEEKKFLDFLKEQGITTSVAKFFALKNDYHNAEAFIKCKYLKIEDEGMTVPDGTMEKSLLKERILTDDYISLPQSMQQALVTCDGDFASSKATGASVNAAFTKAYFENLYDFARQEKNLKKIYSFKVDCINIGAAIRVRKYSAAKEWFLPHGSLSEKELKALCEEPLENLKEIFRFTDYKTAVSLAVDAKLKGQPLTEFEKLADEFALGFMNKQKYCTEGNVLLINYCLRKTSEIFSVRQILVGLANGIDKTDIRNKLRVIYEG